MMTAISAMAFILAAIQFVEQDLPDLGPGMPPLNESFPLEFRHADLNGDQLPDLITPQKVFLQKNGMFDMQNGLPFPITVQDGAVSCDVFGRNVFLNTKSALKVFTIEDGQWRIVLDQPMVRVGTVFEHSFPGDDMHEGYVSFDNFLQDIDGDGVPEITTPTPEGIVIYSNKDQDSYTRRAVLDVFPPLAIDVMGGEPLWPEADRRVILPRRSMLCQYVLEKNRLTLISRSYIPEKQLQYRISRYLINPDADGGYAVGDFTGETSRNLPPSMQPTELSKDGRIGYAGGHWRLSEENVIPSPLSEIKVSTDGGQTIQTFRSVAFGSVNPFVDIDGDGDLDLVAESTGMFDGGARETVMRFLTAREIQHEIRVHLQDAKGEFAKTPAMTHRFVIYMDSPAVKTSNRMLSYQRGRLMSLEGDFDGDKRHDLLVYDKPDRLAVYLNKIDSFSSSPDIAIAVGPDTDFKVLDLDGDGCSDIAAAWQMPDGKLRVRIYLARKGN